MTAAEQPAPVASVTPIYDALAAEHRFTEPRRVPRPWTPGLVPVPLPTAVPEGGA